MTVGDDSIKMMNQKQLIYEMVQRRRSNKNYSHRYKEEEIIKNLNESYSTFAKDSSIFGRA